LPPLRLTDLFPAAEAQRVTSPGSGFAVDKTHRNEGRGPAATEEHIPTRWRVILSYEMQGFTKKKIAEQLGMTESAVAQITRDHRYIKYRNDYLAMLDEEFFNLKPLAIDALKTGLQSNDENVALRASDQWFTAASYGGYNKKDTGPQGVTAEDVAKQLMLGIQVNVNVNDKSE